MSYQPPVRNVTSHDEHLFTGDGERVTVRYCFLDGKPNGSIVYWNGAKVKEYQTERGLARFLKSIGAVAVVAEQPKRAHPDYDIPTLAEPGCAVCGSMQPHAVHWEVPLDQLRHEFEMMIVAEACSEEHSDLIESARDARGVLTPAAIERVVKAHRPA